MHIRQILQRRDAIRAELHTLMNEHADGPLPPDVEQRATELEAEAASLNAAERRQVLLDELDRRATGQQLIGSADAGFDQLARQVEVLDVIRAQMGIQDAATARAREVSAELERRSGRKAEGLYFPMGARTEQRVFTTANPVGGPGSNLIETSVSPNLIDRLRERLIVRRMGATVLTGLTGNVSIPRLKASATAYWVAENSAITVSDPQTDAVTLSPHHCGGIVEISRNMIQQPSLDVTRMVEMDLAKIIAVAIDKAAIHGGGSNEPTGVLLEGLTDLSAGGGGAAPTWNAVVNLISAVDVANALDGSLAFATNAAVVAKMRKTLKTTADTSSNFIMSDATTLAGYPLYSSQLVPNDVGNSPSANNSTLIFGDWSQLVLGFWSELDILVNPYESTAYSKGNVQVRAMATCDVAVRQPLAFATITDLVTS